MWIVACHRHMLRFEPSLGMLGAEGTRAHRELEKEAVVQLGLLALPFSLWLSLIVAHFYAWLSLFLPLVSCSSKSEHHATDLSLPLTHLLQALHTSPP